ncbi:hypothetical protein B566_EDAN011313 [Ephemera danica]|nr:hypothetical protein B566_EDAN011313 [Ephemera danica]
MGHPQVTIPGLGIVEGGTDFSSVNNRTFYRFLGIPFAAPPLGSLRYQPPQAAESWEGILNAKRVGSACPQILVTSSPQLDETASLPVIVFYHGGAFRYGSAHMYGAGRFMDEDVVLVLPHYRLGPLGFLSLDTDELAGNAAMLDQVAALHWVRDHIAVFGGDPNSITVMGESAGAVSSSLLAISPLSTGLFQRYIVQSGAGVASWAIDRDNVRAATEIGRLAGCSEPETEALTTCLMTVDVDTLLQAHDQFQKTESFYGRSAFSGSAPVIQKAGAMRFLEREPRDILEEGDYQHKPALLGSNKHEGTLIWASFYVLYLEPNGLLNETEYFYREFTNVCLEYFGISPDQGESLAVGVEKSFFGRENIGNLTAMIPGLVDFFGDMYLKGPTYDQAVYNAKFSSTYKYSFDFLGENSMWSIIGFPNVIDGGVCHANELLLLFDMLGFTLTDEEIALSRSMIKLWMLALALVGPIACQGPPVIVTIPGLGDVQGDTEVSAVSGREFNRFRGVPFPPQPPAAWPGVLDATKYGRACPQLGESTVGDAEDCLFTHVYTPTLNSTALLPVIIYIHGGGFRAGSAQGWGPERFMDEDVVLVLPHYRLGPFGFLCLDTDQIAGNAGLLDQVAAVQWVRDYISVFGGDPDSITVMGESAGAASSSFLAISPLSTGLFQRYIAESGSATGGWAIDRDPVRAATEIGGLAGCDASDINALTDCLMTVDVDTLISAYNTFQNSELLSGAPFFGGGGGLPVIQKAGALRFLEREPVDILEEGAYVHKPALLGSNKHEGSWVYAWLHQTYYEPNGLLNDTEYWKREGTNFCLDFYRIQDQGESLAAGIEKAFFGEENMGNHTAMVPGMIDYLGDMYLKGPVFDLAIANSKYSPTYHYAYDFQGRNTLWGVVGFPSVIPGGVCHGNELIMLFTFPLTYLDNDEKALSIKMVKLWSNFATYGNPTPPESPVDGVPTWLPMSKAEDNYLRLTSTPYMATNFTVNEYFIARDQGDIRDGIANELLDHSTAASQNIT